MKFKTKNQTKIIHLLSCCLMAFATVTTAYGQGQTDDQRKSRFLLALKDHQVMLEEQGTNVELRPSEAPQTSNSFGLGGSKRKTWLRGARAIVRTTEISPKVLFIAPTEVEPNGRFVLLRFTLKEGNREFGTKVSDKSPGVSIAFTSDTIVNTRIVRVVDLESGTGIKKSVYRLSVTDPIPPGEYAFVTSNYAYFDFGIDPIKTPSKQNRLDDKRGEAGLNERTAVTPSILDERLPIYGSIDDLKRLRHVYVIAADSQARGRIVKILQDSGQIQVVGDPQDAEYFFEYKVLTRDKTVSGSDSDTRVKGQAEVFYSKGGKKIVAWSDTAEFARLLTSGIGFRTEHNEVKLAKRFLKAIGVNK